MSTPPPWLDRLRAELDEEFQGRPAVAAMATADASGSPSVRAVVVRRIDPESGALTVATDGRSDKAGALRSRPEAEVSFWLLGPRVQYRLKGSVDRLDTDEDADARRALWASLSDAARALFSWPAPGSPRIEDPESFPARVAASDAVPDSFLPLRLRPVRVERLDLSPHPHLRTRWRLGTGWTPEELNP